MEQKTNNVIKNQIDNMALTLHPLYNLFYSLFIVIIAVVFSNTMVELVIPKLMTIPFFAKIFKVTFEGDKNKWNLTLSIIVFFISWQTLNNKKNQDTVKKINEKVDAISSLNSKFDLMIVNSEKRADVSLSGLIKHLKEDYYTRCKIDSCGECSKYSSKCDGLFRSFLSRECEILHEAVEDIGKGKFELNRSIEEYHTIAIDHMISQKLSFYNVIHYLGEKEQETEQYTNYDKHFLTILFDKIFIKNKSSKNMYYEDTGFKINWLLVGDVNNILNNYDYVVRLIQNHENKAQIEKLFNFYCVTTDNFRDKFASEKIKKEYININSPNLGVFGNSFIFVESSNHGDFYSAPYHPIEKINSFFEQFVLEKNRFKWNDIYNLYLTKSATKG